MSKMTWIIVLVVVGIALAVVVGVLGTRNEPSTSSAAPRRPRRPELCTSVKNLSTTLQGLANIDPSTITSTEIQTDITSVENAWNQVRPPPQRCRTPRRAI